MNNPKEAAEAIGAAIAAIVVAGAVLGIQAYAVSHIVVWFNGPTLAYWQWIVIILTYQSLKQTTNDTSK